MISESLIASVYIFFVGNSGENVSSSTFLLYPTGSYCNHIKIVQTLETS